MKPIRLPLPAVSVLVVNWNTLELTCRCIESLLPDIESGLAQVIVTDNASSDGSAEELERRFPMVELVRASENGGFARATNQAHALARGRYALMLNSDALVEPDAMRLAVDYLDEHPHVGALGAKLLNPDGSRQNSCFRQPNVFSILMVATYLAQLFPRSAFFNRDRYGLAEWDEPRAVEVCMGSFLLVRRAALGDEELLDDGYFMYSEESDLCFRLRRAGYQVVYFPASVATHVGGGSTRSPRVDAWAYLAKRRAKLRFLSKWRGLPFAMFVNALMLVALAPRVVGWVLGDLLRRRVRSSYRLRAVAWHSQALVAPTKLRERARPPAA